MRKLLAVAIVAGLTACGGSGDAGPTTPPPPKVDSTKPASIRIIAPTAASVSATPGQLVAVSVQVLNVVDLGIPNLPVTISASGGTVSLSLPSTDIAGVIRATWNVGSEAGQKTLTASVPGTSLAAHVTATVALPPVTGSWSGTVGTQTVAMTIVENNGVVSGSGTITRSIGTAALIVNGTFLNGSLTATFSGGTLNPFSYQAVLEPTIGRTLTGTLTGSGFTGEQLVMGKTSP